MNCSTSGSRVLGTDDAAVFDELADIFDDGIYGSPRRL